MVVLDKIKMNPVYALVVGSEAWHGRLSLDRFSQKFP